MGPEEPRDKWISERSSHQPYFAFRSRRGGEITAGVVDTSVIINTFVVCPSGTFQVRVRASLCRFGMRVSDLCFIALRLTQAGMHCW